MDAQSRIHGEATRGNGAVDEALCGIEQLQCCFLGSQSSVGARKGAWAMERVLLYSWLGDHKAAGRQGSCADRGACGIVRPIT